jgi:hypothetical protein
VVIYVIALHSGTCKISALFPVHKAGSAHKFILELLRKFHLLVGNWTLDSHRSIATPAWRSITLDAAAVSPLYHDARSMVT